MTLISMQDSPCVWLVRDDGTVLVDSTLILDYAETLPPRSLMPAWAKDDQHRHRLVIQLAR